MIEEKLLEKISFIREGHLSESGGPALRLVGDVEPVGGVIAREPVGVGIHAEDLYRALFEQRSLDRIEARSYLRETAYEASPYMPVHYFVSLAGISRDQAVELLQSTTTTSPAVKRRLVERLADDYQAEAIGALGSTEGLPAVRSADELRGLVLAHTAAKDQRTVLARALADHPEYVRAVWKDIEPVRVLEAISHLDPVRLEERKREVLRLLAEIFEESFEHLEGNSRTVFRKAVAVVDHRLYFE